MSINYILTVSSLHPTFKWRYVKQDLPKAISDSPTKVLMASAKVVSMLILLHLCRKVEGVFPHVAGTTGDASRGYCFWSYGDTCWSTPRRAIIMQISGYPPNAMPPPGNMALLRDHALIRPYLFGGWHCRGTLRFP